MSAAKEAPASARASKIAVGIGGGVVAVLAVLGGWLAALVGAAALLGMPLFAIMGGTAELSWLTHHDETQRHLRFIAPSILDAHFSDSPILVTIPLFTLVGYVLAESRTPDRLVRGARAVFGWMPGGLAIVCIIASAVFTLLTGGSGVTIIAIGGLLYPALRKEKYSEKFSLGLVTAGGSVGLLLPLSLPLMVFSLVAQVDYIMAFRAVLLPGAMVIAMLAVYAGWVGWRDGIARETPTLKEIGESLWDLKWELFIPVILVVGLGSGLTDLDEVAGLVALYTLLVELFLYKDISWKKDVPRILRASMSMAGAIILILAMANALMHYVNEEGIPRKLLDLLIRMGIEHKWQFLIVMNIFLLVLGMLMEGFSAILISVPLLLPFVAELGRRHPDEAMSPFQLAMIFILNLELAYSMPPLGLNLFIGAFRFNKPVTQLYRVVMPFVGILAIALMIVSYVPWISNVAIMPEIARIKEKAAKDDAPPKAAWMLECVQDDSTDPKPCTEEDRKKWGTPADEGMDGGAEEATDAGEPCNPDMGPCDAPSAPCNPDMGPCDAPTDAGAPCNPDFGPCDGPSAPPPAATPCNPDFGPCD